MVDEDDAGVDRDPDAGAADHYIFEAVGGDADLDFADELDADPTIEWLPYHPLDPKAALAVALRSKENDAILASAATKRGIAEQKTIAAYINQSGKLLSERYPLSPGTLAAHVHLGSSHTKGVAEALEHQENV